MAKEVSFQGMFTIGVLLILASVFTTMLVLNQTPYPSVSGLATGIAKVNVTGIVAISLPVNSANFGDISPGSSDNTTDDSPPPFIVQNDGTVKVDVTIARDNESTPLFNGTGGGDNSTSFQFKVDDNETDSINKEKSIINWTNVPGTTPLTFIGELKYQDNHDSARVDLLINVPADEPPGLKNETLIFIAVQS